MSPSTPDPQLTFTRLFVANQAALHGYLVSLVHDLHTADDLLQDLAGRLWLKFDSYDHSRPFVAWGLGFARIVALEWRRKQARLPLTLDDQTLEALANEALTFSFSHDARRDALHHCLQTLTDHQRKTLELRYHQDHSVATIASSWHRSEVAIYKVLKHAHQSLLACINKTLALQDS